MSGDFTSARLQHAQILLDQGRFAEAEKIITDALSQDPNDIFLLYSLAKCQWQQDKNKEALATLDRAIALHPFESDFFATRSLILTNLRQSREAHKAADEAISKDPHSSFAFCAKSAAYARDMKWKECEASAREALSIDPDDEMAASLLANALRYQNRLAESSDQIAYMLSRNPEAGHNHANAGWNQLQRGDHKAAEQHFLEALRLDPNDENAREGLKEAFRARSPIYRAYLNYCFFMQRFTAEKQVVLLIGFLIFINVSNRIFTGPLAIVGLLLAVVYLLFVLWVHVAKAVGNLQLLFDRFARHALTRRESVEAIVVGGGVVVGLLLFIPGIFTGIDVARIIGITLIGAAFPLAYTFTNRSRKGALVFGGCALYVLGIGLAVAIRSLLPQAVALSDTPKTPLDRAAELAIYVVIGVTWLSNVPSLRRGD